MKFQRVRLIIVIVEWSEKFKAVLSLRNREWERVHSLIIAVWKGEKPPQRNHFSNGMALFFFMLLHYSSNQ